MLEGSLCTKLSTELTVGFVLILLDGTVKTDRFLDGMEEGWVDTLGKLDGINVGTPVLIFSQIGLLDS